MHFENPIELLDSISGIDKTAAYAILAEIGQDMSAFPTAKHICSWAGLAPGSHQSAKKKKQRVTHGNNYLKSMLKKDQPFNKDTFLEHRQASERRRFGRMMNELTRLSYAVTPAS